MKAGPKMAETKGKRLNAVFYFERLELWLNSLGTVWIIILMVIIDIDVFGRTLLNSPLPGVPELVRLSIVGIIFIQIGHTLRSGRLTRSDYFIRFLQRRWPRIGYGLQAVYGFASSFLFAVIMYASTPFFVRSWTGYEFAGIEGYITFPVWPVRLIILIGCACACIQFLIFTWKDLVIVFGRRPPDGETGAGESSSFDLGILK